MWVLYCLPPQHGIDYAPVAMLYVEKDLSAITKAIFDQWDAKEDELNHQYLYCTNARITPSDITKSVKKGKLPHLHCDGARADEVESSVTGKDCVYTVLPTTTVPDRDIMFQLYNEMGMYGTKEIPDPNVLKLGVQLHDIDDFVRSKLAPHLGLPVIA